MKITAAKIKNSLIAFFGIDRLNSQFLNFAVSHLCFVIAINIHSVFVNILLMRVSDDVNITIYYNMISYFCSGFGMLLGGMIIKRLDLKYITFLGIGCHVVAYGIFLFFMDEIAVFMIPLAILIGFGGGFLLVYISQRHFLLFRGRYPGNLYLLYRRFCQYYRACCSGDLRCCNRPV